MANEYSIRENSWKMNDNLACDDLISILGEMIKIKSF